MATTSIWRVKGWLGKVVVYVENPDKTTNPKFYTDEDMTEQDGQQLSDVIRYAINSEKTQEMGSEDGAPLHRFVSGINCSPATARDEMLAVKKRFGVSRCGGALGRPVVDALPVRLRHHQRHRAT